MWEKNLNQRLLLIGVVLVCAFALIGNPKDSLRPGLDIAGGASLIFEIDDTGMEKYSGLAEDMKRLLQKRVDPKGVYDLTWRVHGRKRLEVQMPLPPPKARELREAYSQALQNLLGERIKRSDLEEAIQKTGVERAEALKTLGRGSAEWEQLAWKVAEAYDAWVAARDAYRAGPQTTQPESRPADAATQPTTAPTSAPAKTLEDLKNELDNAEVALEDAKDAFMDTNLDGKRFVQILELEKTSAVRGPSLEEFKEIHPELKDQIDDVIAKHEAWRENRGFLDSTADLQRLLRGAGVLEFRILPRNDLQNVTRYDRYRRQLEERGPDPVPGDELGWFKVDNPLAFFDQKTPEELESYDLTTSPFVAAKRGADYYVLAKLGPQDGLLNDKTWQLRNAYVDRDQRGRPSVAFQLDVVGGKAFEELTRRNIDQPLCILVDDIAYSAPNIKSKIGMYGTITGDFGQDKAAYLAQTMQAGSLPARLKDTPISERTIDSSLGATNRDKAFRAGVIGVIVVALLMAIYYLVCGLIANAALLMNVVLVLAVMAMLQARFTLAGIAGVILTIGMSVDANVLIFERMREERARGSSLRLIIKNGYEKAFSTIIDANITTLLTCVILYYVGSEEIKGFGLTLGWGIAMSLFTALFVTRTIFTLLIKYGLIKDVKMLSFIGVPKVNWYAKRKFFLPLSLVVVISGLGLLVERGYRDFLDVEFLGGVSAEVEVKPPAEGQEPLDDVKIGALLNRVGESITADADKLAQADVRPVVGSPNQFQVSVPDVSSDRLAAMLTEPFEDREQHEQWSLQRGGVEQHGAEGTLTARIQGEVAADELQKFVRGQVDTIKSAGDKIASASVGAVVEAGFHQQAGRFWNVTTTAKNRRLVQQALTEALGDRLKRQQRVHYVFHGTADGRPYPITDRRLENVIPDIPAGTVSEPLTDYLGGAAMYFTNLDPPQCVDPDVAGSLPDRLRNMRLQPGYQDYSFRYPRVIGVTPVGSDSQGHTLYSSVAVVVADEHYRYSDDPETWYTELAQKELDLTTAALDTEQALRKVSQFKPQIARQSSTQASLALLLSWGMIIGYLWIRFGRPMYGVAGVVALIHDVCIALAFVGIAGWIGGMKHPLGAFFLIDDFKINMTIVAAFLTIIGYSINDTIVVFDRIRETRGRLGVVTPQIINDSINQCMARTLLTSATTFVILLVMYIFGGPSIRGFNYCMMIGVLTGTYSSIAVAAPLLMAHFGRRRRPVTA